MKETFTAEVIKLNNNIEHIIKKVITIDEEAEHYKKLIQKSLEDKREELREQIAMMEKEAEDNLMKRKKEINDVKCMEIANSIQAMKVKREVEIKKIKENYEKSKEEIVKSAVGKIKNLCTQCDQ